MSKFDKLVNEILNEGFTKKVMSNASPYIEDGDSNMPLGAVASTKSGVNKTIEGLKIFRKAIKTTDKKDGYKAGGKIVDQALYDKGLKYFYNLGRDPKRDFDLNDSGDETSGLCEVIFMHISNDAVGYQLFDDISNAFHDGSIQAIRDEEKKNKRK